MNMHCAEYGKTNALWSRVPDPLPPDPIRDTETVSGMSGFFHTNF